jgi:predicted glycoside hydrolase/deacetylase ChbG (UPF0249 family)
MRRRINISVLIHLLLSLLLVSSCTSVRFENRSLVSARHEEKRQVILTADDFGASENINRGIRRGIEAGVINSVSAMVTFPGAVREICRLQKDFPDVEIGLHLSISSGYPVSSPQDVPSLTGPGGGFHAIDELMCRLEGISLEELEGELRKQINSLKDAGVLVRHLSSQHNILGLYTPFFDVVLRLAEEYHIPLRSSVPVSVALDDFSTAKTRQRGRELAARVIGKDIVSAINLRKYASLEEMEKNQTRMNDLHIKHPDYLVDAFWGNPTPDNLFHILTYLPPGASEIVFHLGVNDNDLDAPHGIEGEYYLMRNYELYCVTSPELPRWLELLNIEVIGFSDL